MTFVEVASPPGPIAWTHTAFRGLYDMHVRAVHAVAARSAGSKAAEDVTQEVFLRLWRHPERYDPARGSLRGYLLTVTRSVALDMVRSETARRTREGRATSSGGQPPAEADHEALAADGRSTIARALDVLSPEEHQAIVAAFYGRCTYREAALELGLPEGTIKSRIRSGLQRMHLYLAQLEGAVTGEPRAGRPA